MKPTIAIVEDDEPQRTYYAEALKSQGYVITEYESREAAIKGFEKELPDLAILDIILQDEVGGGYEVCRFLKQCDAALPVIFLTSRGDELDKIYGLQLGAWDYQTKPVSLEFLIVRIKSFFEIKALTMQANMTSHQDIRQCGKLQINTDSMQCYWGDREIYLTPTEFSIVYALIRSEQAVSIDTLIKATHQGIVEDNTINTHILHIRKKFKQYDAAFQCIKTRYGLGYQWLYK